MDKLIIIILVIISVYFVIRTFTKKGSSCSGCSKNCKSNHCSKDEIINKIEKKVEKL